MEWLLIGAVAKRSGLSAPTIRYHEDIGLLAKPKRTSSGYRQYPEDVVSLLRFVQLAQGLGLSLDQVKPLARLLGGGKAPSAALMQRGRQHLALARRRIHELEEFCASLGAICGERSPADADVK